MQNVVYPESVNDEVFGVVVEDEYNTMLLKTGTKAECEKFIAQNYCGGPAFVQQLEMN